ncbi:beta-ketoacyl synthase N-terminal-like domain-containing protein, partial [Halorubrum pallidum]
MDRRVVVTGVGAVTPLGTSAPDTWEGLIAGESGAGRIQRFDPGTAGLRTEIACEISGNPTDPNTVDERSVGRAAEYGMAAAAEALADAGYDPSAPN